jgi:hypothetical protein
VKAKTRPPRRPNAAKTDVQCAEEGSRGWRAAGLKAAAHKFDLPLTRNRLHLAISHSISPIDVFVARLIGKTQRLVDQNWCFHERRKMRLDLLCVDSGKRLLHILDLVGHCVG